MRYNLSFICSPEEYKIPQRTSLSQENSGQSAFASLEPSKHDNLCRLFKDSQPGNEEINSLTSLMHVCSQLRSLEGRSLSEIECAIRLDSEKFQAKSDSVKH